MSKNAYYFPANQQERRETLQKLRQPDHIDVMGADTNLGLAAQDHCSTRDELVEYAWNNNLVPYLRFFLERRGWLDEDWTRRIERLETEFRQQSN